MTAKSTTSNRAKLRHKTATSSRPRRSPSSSRSSKGASSKKGSGKTSAAKKKRATRKPTSTRKPSTKTTPTKRQRYNSLGQHEVCYQAWLAEGTFSGAARRLQTIEGFESIDVRTLQSIYKEHQLTEDDWDDRAKRFFRELAERIDSDTAEEIASMNAALRKKTLKGLLKVAAVAFDGLPGAVKRVLDDVTKGNASTQERLYGFPKLFTALVNALRPPQLLKGGGVNVPIDNRRLVLNLGPPVSPRQVAKVQTHKQLETELARKERECDAEVVR